MPTVLKTRPAKVQKKNLTFKELLSYYMERSEIRMTASDSSISPEWIEIEFHGEAGRIPSLKNNKANAGWLTKDVKARIYNLDRCWERDISQRIDYGDELLSGVLICGDRGRRRFDTDNCSTTIRDWLEPGTKQAGRTRRSRGWGVGMVEDDTNVRILPLKAADLGREDKHSTLILTKAKHTRLNLVEYVAAHYLGQKEPHSGEFQGNLL